MPKRIAIIGNAAYPLSNFRGPLIAELVSQGNEVLALAPDFDGDSRERVAALGARTVDYPLARTGLNVVVDARNAAALRKILRTLAPDVVLSFGIKPVVYGTLAAAAVGVPKRFALITGLGYAFTVSGRVSWKRRLIGGAARALYRHALRRAHRVFVQNPDDAADLVRLGIARPQQLATVSGTGVSLEEWTPAAPVTSPVTFALAARMVSDKGIFEFVQAGRHVKAAHPDARFLLLGGLDSNPEAIAESQLRSWVGEGIVEWLGHVDMRPWLARTSVFVLPSYREGVPRSTQEAMAMARPVITTNAPGCRETVIEGVNGFLVPPRDVTALVAAMCRFIDQPSLIAKMGRESRRLAEERFDVRRINARMIEVMGL